MFTSFATLGEKLGIVSLLAQSSQMAPRVMDA
jgi:hypothetical protein